ncbi:MAG: hypothetical protein ACREF3_02125 [Acetobacteraceae bacterium]
MRRSAVATAVLLTVCSPAFGADLPLLHPDRDVAVVYRAEGSSRDGRAPQSGTIRMYWGDNGNELRVELDGQPVVALIDFKRQRMAMLFKPAKVLVETKLDPRLVPGFVLPSDANVTRAGTDTVAGVGCTVWDLSGRQGKGSACITQDGVVLRAKGEATEEGSGRLEAVSVTYATQPASLFAAPPDFKRMDPGTPRR